MLDSLLKECFRRPLVGRLPSFIVVPAKKNRIDLRVILQHRLITRSDTPQDAA